MKFIIKIIIFIRSVYFYYIAKKECIKRGFIDKQGNTTQKGNIYNRFLDNHYLLKSRNLNNLTDADMKIVNQDFEKYYNENYGENY